MMHVASTAYEASTLVNVSNTVILVDCTWDHPCVVDAAAAASSSTAAGSAAAVSVYRVAPSAQLHTWSHSIVLWRLIEALIEMIALFSSISRSRQCCQPALCAPAEYNEIMETSFGCGENIDHLRTLPFTIPSHHFVRPLGQGCCGGLLIPATLQVCFDTLSNISAFR